MIKIIKGFYGAKMLDSKSAPFSLDKKEEERLVKLGVAQYVSAPEKGAEAVDAVQEAEAETEAVETESETTESEATEEPAKKRGRPKKVES